MRAHQLGERRDLAGMVHADLEHGVFGARPAARERQRHAPVIVVGGGRGMRLAVGGEREAQRLLGAGLADRAGDGDDLGRASARARRGRDRARPSSTSSTSKQRRIGGKARALARARRRRAPAPAFSAASTKSWPSRFSPWMAKKASPLPSVRLSMEMPRHVGRQRAGFVRAHRRAAMASMCVQSAAHATFPCKRRGDRLVVGELQHAVADDLAGLVALAGDQQHVAFFQRGDAGADRLARGRRSRWRPARRPEWRRGCAAGFSLRGLSSVTMTRSAFSAAMRPMIGRLPASRSPPAPNTTMSLPLA